MNNFHEALVSAKDMFEKNQYPPPFYEPIVENTISKMFSKKINKLQSPNRMKRRRKSERKTGTSHSVDGI